MSGLNTPFRRALWYLGFIQRKPTLRWPNKQKDYTAYEYANFGDWGVPRDKMLTFIPFWGVGLAFNVAMTFGPGMIMITQKERFRRRKCDTWIWEDEPGVTWFEI